MQENPMSSVTGLMKFLSARARRGEGDTLTKDEATQIIFELLPVALPNPNSMSIALRDMIDASRVADAISQELAGEPERAHLEILEDAMMEGKLRRRIFQEQMLSTEDASRALGSDSSNLRQLANQQRKKSELLGIPHKNTYLYPAFQFDLIRSQINETAAKVNKLLDAVGDPWGVASWWITPSGSLVGSAPKDLLGTDREEQVLGLARAELEATG